MGERVTFWYGCNVLRHGDIIHACLDILRAVGFEPSPVGGPDYCCGTVKDANQGAAGGLPTVRAWWRGVLRATRTCTTSWRRETSAGST